MELNKHKWICAHGVNYFPVLFFAIFLSPFSLVIAIYKHKSITANRNEWSNWAFFPDRLKTVIVKPLYRKGIRKILKTTDPLVSYHLPNILENLMNNTVAASVIKTNILTKAKNGFREGKSTETFIYYFLENIKNAIGKRRIKLIGIFFDLCTEVRQV